MKAFERAKNFVESKIDPRDSLEGEIPYLSELHVTDPEITWITDTKQASEKISANEERAEEATAYDLIKLYVMMQRQLQIPAEDRKYEYLEKNIEQKIDEIDAYLIERSKKMKGTTEVGQDLIVA